MSKEAISLENEEWRNPPGISSVQVSSLGRARRVEQTHKHGTRWILCVSKPRNDYPRVRVGDERYLLHRLVAEAFIDPCPDGLQVNHKDGNKHNAAAANLEYVTPSQNVQHGYDTGLSDAVRSGASKFWTKAHAEGRVRHITGSAHHSSKLNESKASEVKKLIAGGMGDTAIGRLFGVARETIRQIRHGKTWKTA